MAYATWLAWPLWAYATPAAMLVIAFEPISRRFPKLYSNFYVQAYIASAAIMQLLILVLAFIYLLAPNKSTADGVVVCAVLSKCG